jgi:plastocyanin
MLNKTQNRILWIVTPSIVGFSILAFVILASMNSNASSYTNNSYKGVKREFWISDTDIPGFNETQMNMPRDVFSISSMTVTKGDTVVIHFFNIESPGGDNHSFTIWDKPYNLNVVVHPGENKTITFDATTAGVFAYLCTFHQPTMRGQLVVQMPENQ